MRKNIISTKEWAIHSLPEPPAPISLESLRITRVVRECEDEFEQGAKTSCHALNLEPQALLPKHLGLACTDRWGLVWGSITSTGKHKRSRGHLGVAGTSPRPKEELPTSPSSLASYVSSFSDCAPSLPSAGKGKGLVYQAYIHFFHVFGSTFLFFLGCHTVIPSGVLTLPHWRNFKWYIRCVCRSYFLVLCFFF